MVTLFTLKITNIISHKGTDKTCDCIFPFISNRLSELGNTLDGVGFSLSSPDSDSSLDSDEIVSEIISELTGGTRPFKCYGDVKTPLYEKVVCEIPILVLDKENRPASDDDLTRIRF